MKVTANVHQIIQAAMMCAKKANQPAMPIHLLYGCAVVGNCLASRYMASVGITREKLETVTSAPTPDMSFEQVLQLSLNNSHTMNQPAVVSEALLLALLQCSQTKTVLEELKQGSSTQLLKLIKGEEAVSDVAVEKNLPEDILRLGSDLTRKARDGKIDPIVGREDETARVIEILSRKTKNNPCLIGEAGVGKSAIVEGLALRIINDNVPESLKNKTVFSLEIGSLMAGTKYRGELEARLERLLKLIEERGDIILFIDEIHTITTAGGGKENEVGIAEILKPKLARGGMQTIGATTTEEYRRFIEKDAALERRFAPIIVNPPTTGQAIEILEGLRESFEKFHNIKISQDAIEAAVVLSDRYIPERNLPDKAIDILDEACAKVKLNGGELDIAGTISKITGIPVTKLTAGEKEKLANLEIELGKSIVGQDKAISAIAKAVRRSRAGVADADRPVGSFMFLGRTGVGKTEVCRVLASQLFTSDKCLIKLDMSEFSESHSTSKLVGSPPGYVGYDDATALTERVRRNPYCLVLFDEIEKAHPDVYNVLLQILDEGRLTDSHGKTTSFKNALIVMTSNVGVENINKTKKIGFNDVDLSGEEESAMMAGLKKKFKPEFINRIDNVIVFNSLTESDVAKIAKIQINKLGKKLGGLGIALKVSPDVIKHLAEKGYHPEYGARPLRRLLQSELEDKIAERILSEDKIKQVAVELSKDGIVFTYQ